MKRLTLMLLGVALMAACGGTSGRAQSDQDRDGRTLAAAIRDADDAGSGFNLDQTLVLTGGDVPSGQEFRLHAVTTNGVLRSSGARFPFRVQQGRQTVALDGVFADDRLYMKGHSGSAWKTTPLSTATGLLTALRLDLVRQTVLLASSIDTGSVSHVDAGFARRYVVRPGPDQLEELESIPLMEQTEQQFLKTATAEVDVFLVIPSNKLGRIEVHLTGADPQTGTRQQIDSVLDLHSARVGPIQPPADAQPVAPGDILTP
jgi:hypothetical protein